MGAQTFHSQCSACAGHGPAGHPRLSQGSGHKSLKGDKTGLVHCTSAHQASWWAISSHSFSESSHGHPCPRTQVTPESPTGLSPGHSQSAWRDRGRDSSKMISWESCSGSEGRGGRREDRQDWVVLGWSLQGSRKQRRFHMGSASPRSIWARWDSWLGLPWPESACSTALTSQPPFICPSAWGASPLQPASCLCHCHCRSPHSAHHCMGGGVTLAWLVLALGAGQRQAGWRPWIASLPTCTGVSSEAPCTGVLRITVALCFMSTYVRNLNILFLLQLLVFYRKQREKIFIF